MKQFKTLILIAVVALGFNSVQAQSKVGHISIDQLISLMPETKVMTADLEKLSKTYETEIKAENDKLQAKLKKYDAEAASQTDEVNQQRQIEVQQDNQRLQQSAGIAQQDIQTKRDEKLQPIIEKARKAIQEVADEGGYTYVLEASSIIVANGTDLLPLVKAKLGIQ
jgi:outer membrane protein